MAPSKDEVTTFSFKIETIAKNKSISYMEAVIEYCDEIGLEVEIGAKMISGALKSKIKIKAEELHFLPKSNTYKLPV